MDRRTSFAIMGTVLVLLAACGGGGGSEGTPLPPTSGLLSIVVEPLYSSINEGTTQQFTATGWYSTTTMDLTKYVTWGSDDTNCATIDKNGLATGVAAGWTIKITAAYGSITGVAYLDVTVPPGGNNAPVANAGPDQNDVKTGSVVFLDGSLSYDQDGDGLTYSWAFTSKPANSIATLSGPAVVDPSFTPDLDGTYTLSLVVNDGQRDSTVDTVNIGASTFNSPPEADAGADQNIVAGALATVTLDGGASSDLDGDPLTYAWAFHTKPAESTAAISNTSAISPTFTADVEGIYTLTLVVNDGIVDSTPATVTVTAYRYISSLGFRVIDAEYSKQLDKIIMVSAMPLNQLHIYDPVTEQDTAVNLPLASSSVSVSPDGLHAAVGHNAWVSYVDLSSAALVKTISTTADVIDVVLAGNGYIYAFPRIDQWETIRCINIATEQETRHAGNSIRAGTKAKLHPSGTAIYGADNGLSPSDIEKYDISGGTAAYLYDSPYHGDYSMCGDLWISEDGLRIFTRCGNVFRSSTVRAEDMTYNGALEGLGSVRHLTHSAAIGNVVAAPANTWNNGLADREIQVFGYDYLTFKERITLPHFVVNGNVFPGHGRFVFYSSDGSIIYSVIQADATSGLLYDYGVVQY